MSHHIGIKLFIVFIIIALFAAGSYFWLKGDFGGIKLPNSSDINIEQAENEPLASNAEIDNEVLEKARSTSLRSVQAISGSDHYQGNLEAPVQLIAYNDFQCGYSAQFTSVLEQVKDEFNEQVVIAVRHFPLRSNSRAYQAALAAECAAEQDKFWEMHDKLFSSQDNGFSTEVFENFAIELELDTTRFNDCLDEEKYKDKIQTQIEQGKSCGVTGTPGIFVNTEPHAGAVPFEDFTDSQDREREGMKSIIERHLNSI